MYFNDSYIVHCLIFLLKELKIHFSTKLNFVHDSFPRFCFRRPNGRLPVYMLPTIKFALLCASIDDREQDGKTLSLCAIISRISACDVEGPFNLYVHSAGGFRSKVTYSVALYLWSHPLAVRSF